MMKKIIEKVLIEREGYSEKSAKITATDLLNVADIEIKAAVKKWYTTGEKCNVIKDNFSSNALMEHFGMKYPATLVFLDWYIVDPDDAMNSIAYQGG